jgi:hypothetical protein
VKSNEQLPSFILRLIVSIIMLSRRFFLPLTLVWLLELSGAFVPSSIVTPRQAFVGKQQHKDTVLVYSSSSSEEPDKEGADMAAAFFKLAQEKGIGLNDEDLLLDEEEEEEDDEEDEEEVIFPQGAVNAFLGYDTGDVGEKLAGNVSLTNDQLYSEVKERVLDTAGGFVEFLGGAREDDDDDEAPEEKKYEAPTQVPDSELTAGEVIYLVLDAFLNNNVPTSNKGVEIFFGYSSPSSQIKQEKGLTPDEYADFLKETEYKVLFQHEGASIGKADYSFDGKKAFFTARLKVGVGPRDSVSVNFILSTTGADDDACWLIDSMLIRPQSMQRRRRR